MAFFSSTLKEYWVLVNGDCAVNSRRMRTQRAAGVCGAVDRPRATSKSAAKAGCRGMRASAAAICFCSSVEGAQTFSTLTRTGGSCCATAASASISNVLRIFNAAIVQESDWQLAIGEHPPQRRRDAEDW